MPLLKTGESLQLVTEVLGRRMPGLSPSDGAAAGPHGCTHQADACLKAGSDWAGAPLSEVLGRRRSVRAFRPAPVPVQHIQAILTSAYTAEAQTWPHATHGCLAFRTVVAAARIRGLGHGLQAASEDNRSFVSLGELSLAESLQDEYGAAPGLLLIGGDLDQACSSAGGYGRALLRAGTLGYASWLSAISMGLGGTVFGGSSYQVTALMRQLDPRLQHLFTVTVGYPASALAG